MSTLAVQVLQAHGDPVNAEPVTATFPETNGTLDGNSGVGSALTYFEGEFEGYDSKVHKVEARTTDLVIDQGNNEASGKLSAKLNNGDGDQARVVIDAAIMAYFDTKTKTGDNAGDPQEGGAS